MAPKKNRNSPSKKQKSSGGGLSAQKIVGILVLVALQSLAVLFYVRPGVFENFKDKIDEVRQGAFKVEHGAKVDADFKVEKKVDKKIEEPEEKSEKKMADAVAYESIKGVETQYKILQAGNGGKKVSAGNKVTVHATGVAETADGSKKKFWSTKDAGQKPFSYQAGVGQVITGWDQGCLGMEVGETRTLKIPSKEGYGANGFPAWGIPGGATLHFELECISIDG